MYFSFFTGLRCLLGTIRAQLFGKPKEFNSVYCSCGNDLVTDGSFVSDTIEPDGNHVRYCCAKCGIESDWDFDIAPVPLKRPFYSDKKTLSPLLKEGLRDVDCQIIDLNSGKVIKPRGARLFGEFHHGFFED
jgi:hypothetical protein